MLQLSLGENGAPGIVFQACRALQFACLIAIIGVTADFVSEIAESPLALISILCIACLAAFYVIITYVLYLRYQLPKHYTAASDIVLSLALMSTSVALGNPRSYLSCKAGEAGSAGATGNTAADAAAAGYEYNARLAGGSEEDTAAFLSAALNATPTLASLPTATAVVDRSLSARDYTMESSDYLLWVGGAESASACMMTKAVWGFAIALTILFALSTLCLALLWKKEREPRGKEFIAV